MKDSFIPYAQQYLDQDDVQAVLQALNQPILTRGPLVQEFEKTVAKQCKASYAVAFNNGTAALQAAYYAVKTTSYDQIITTPNTFVGTITGGMLYGAKLQLADIDCSTGNIAIENIEALLSENSSRGKQIIVPVHFAGAAVDMELLQRKVRNSQTIIIEDAAHAIGSFYPDGKTRVGSCAWSDLTIFSFHPAKNMTTAEGGMVTTNDAELYHRLQLFRNNGIERETPYLQKTAELGYYEVHEFTGNYHITDLQAALGLSQFKKLDLFISKRRQIVQWYRKRLRAVKHIQLVPAEHDKNTAYHLFVVRIDFAALRAKRQAVMSKLLKQGIGTQIHYIPLYMHPAVQKIVTCNAEDFPETQKYYTQALSLPLFYQMEESQVDFICATLIKTLRNK